MFFPYESLVSPPLSPLIPISIIIQINHSWHVWRSLITQHRLKYFITNQSNGIVYDTTNLARKQNVIDRGRIEESQKSEGRHSYIWLKEAIYVSQRKCSKCSHTRRLQKWLHYMRFPLGRLPLEAHGVTLMTGVEQGGWYRCAGATEGTRHARCRVTL